MHTSVSLPLRFPMLVNFPGRFYAGEETGPEPKKGLCIAQSALLSGVLPMTSVALLGLVYHTWSCMNSAQAQHRPRTCTATIVETLGLSAPYFAFAIFAGIGAKLATQHPEKVSKSVRFFYCSIESSSFNNAVVIFAALISLLSIAVELCLVVSLWHHKCTQGSSSYKLGVNVQFCARVSLLALCMLTATLANLVSIWKPTGVFPDMFTASVGLDVFLIFGTQPAIVRSWWFWRQFSNDLRSSPPVPSRAPYPSFDPDLLKRTDSDVSEKVRLEALHAYYAARVREEGLGIVIIDRPENAFVTTRDHQRALARKC
ncbi:hypothetical protein AcV7_009694 [Taiwanofungus camphoratus]|nr:hypothetical protein AcW2_007449 [Antrodia cinnamomea]KAI0947217.1 hypothetical protein AcV7_009694 [Antrodia cinnamomea]